MNKTIKQAERYEAPETRVIEVSIRSTVLTGSNSSFTEENEEDF